MAEEKNNNTGVADIVSKSASAAHKIQGAIKTGKAIAGIAKGSAGGPYGAVAMGLWENRKTVAKIVAAAAFLLFLPILFILMLPSIIFGELNAEVTEVPIMNNNAAIYSNINSLNNSINSIITSAHEEILKEIEQEIENLPKDSTNEIIDNFNNEVLFDTTILISQYCAYKDNYAEINHDDLIGIVSEHKDNLFSYTHETIEQENTITKTVEVEETIIEYIDSTVTDEDGKTRVVKVPVEKKVTVQKTFDEAEIITCHIYTVNYIGAEYFSTSIFNLDEKKQSLAKDYAENLVIFMNEYDSERVNGNGSHKNIADLIKDDNSSYLGGQFVDPIKNWKNHVTSEFGERTDPIAGEKAFHNGLDIGVGKGTSVYAVADGVVLYTKTLNTGFGYHLAINHGGKIVTLYAHNSKLLVQEGQEVKQGDEIAKTGSTGYSTGPHLHFEVIVDGVPQNPRNYLQ